MENQDKTPNEVQSKFRQRLIAAILLFVFLGEIAGGVLIYTLGGKFGRSSQANDLAEQAARTVKLAEMMQVLKDNYYEDLDDEALWSAIYKGLPGNVGSKFTRYLTKEELKSFRESLKGEYYGIGTVIRTDEGKYSIADIFAESPAERVGLKIGDVFKKINDRDIAEFADVSALAAFVRGVEGTIVNLTVLRPETNETLSFSVPREKVKIIEVSTKDIPDQDGVKIGYIRVKEFSENVAEQFIPELKKLVAANKRNIIIDLRNNPGGDANAMSKMLDAILPEGLISTIKGKYDGKNYQEEWRTSNKVEIPEDVQFAILLNNNSASASEFFSGALRDRGRAKLIGEQTYGKGVATRMHELSDGSAINITTFKYVLPKGESLDGVGLKPDIEVRLDEKLLNTNIEKIPLAQDNQIQRAIKYFLDKQ